MLSVEIKVNNQVIHRIEAVNTKQIEAHYTGLACVKDISEYTVKSYKLRHDRTDGALVLAKQLIDKEIEKEE